MRCCRYCHAQFQKDESDAEHPGAFCSNAHESVYIKGILDALDGSDIANILNSVFARGVADAAYGNYKRRKEQTAAMQGLIYEDKRSGKRKPIA